jgi:hypothetical protein
VAQPPMKKRGFDVLKIINTALKKGAQLLTKKEALMFQK